MTNSPEMNQQPAEKPESGKAPTAVEVALSVIAAALGVQSSKNRERDFTYGSPVVFIFAGFVFTALFVLTIVGVVYLVL